MTLVQTPLTTAAAVTASGALVAGRHTPVSAAAGALVMTLPTPANIGARLRVEKTDATANTVTVSGTFRGSASTLALSTQFETVEVFAESLTSWRVAGSYRPGSGGSSYTDEQAQDAAAALLTSGTHTGVSFTYDDAGNKVNATVTGGGGGATAADLLTRFHAPIGGSISPPYINGNSPSAVLNRIDLGAQILPADTYDLAICRVQTPTAGATVKIVAYAVSRTTGGPTGAPLFETAAVPATSGGYLGIALSTPLVVPDPGMPVWIGLCNQGTAVSTFWATNTAYGLPRILGPGASIDLGGIQPPSVVHVTGVTGAAPTDPTFTWIEGGNAFKIALRRSA